ncbi:MAG: hypothetical protein KIT56_09050 [Gammaproteobacteria bacterium]|nr:hypothetical protein [Gammaproteobacteria bacterium]MCW5584003.1 hypothetical protein [Gammaproteobacteria bacterium]
MGLAFVVNLLEQTQSDSQLKLEIEVIEKRDLQFTHGQKIIVLNDPIKTNGISWDVFCQRNFYPEKLLEIDKDGNLLIDHIIP